MRAPHRPESRPPLWHLAFWLAVAVSLAPDRCVPPVRAEDVVAVEISYESDLLVFVRGQPGSFSPVVLGQFIRGSDTFVRADLYSFPSLPDGIRVHPDSGRLHGTSQATSPRTPCRVEVIIDIKDNEYVIGEDLFDLWVIDDVAPSGLDYTYDTATFTVGESIPPDQASVEGDATAWGVLPQLPAGLWIDQLDGTIRGTPFEASPMTPYTVTASNPLGADQTTLTFTVEGPAVTARTVWTRTANTLGIAEIVQRFGTGGHLVPRTYRYLDSAQGMAALPDGAHVYASSGERIFRYSIDPATGLPDEGQLLLDVGAYVASLAVSASGTRLVAMGDSFLYSIPIDPATGALDGFLESEPIPRFSSPINLHPTEDLAYVPTGFDGSVLVFELLPSLQLGVERLTPSALPDEIEIGPFGQRAYIREFNSTVLTYDVVPAPDYLTQSLSVPDFFPGKAISDMEIAGTRLYMASLNGIDEFNIDPTTGAFGTSGNPSVFIDDTFIHQLVAADSTTLYALGSDSTAWLVRLTGSGPVLGGASRTRLQTSELMVVAGVPTPPAASEWVFSASYDDDTLRAAGLNATGVLTPALQGAVTTNDRPIDVAHERASDSVYVVCESGSIQWFDFDRVTGMLVLDDSLSIGTTPTDIELEPSGRFAYVYDTFGLVHMLDIASDGSLSVGTFSPKAVEANGTFAVDPTGERLIVLGDFQSFYQIAPSANFLGGNGSGTPIASSDDLTVDPRGMFAYTSDASTHMVRTYAISTIGQLNLLAALPTGGSGTRALALDRQAVHLFASNPLSDDVTVYQVVGWAGAISPESWSPILTGAINDGAVSLSVSNDGRFLLGGIDGTSASVASFNLSGPPGAQFSATGVGGGPFGLALD